MRFGLSMIVGLLVVWLQIDVASGLSMNKSWEYILRQHLFHDNPYDKAVRPIVKPTQSVTVRFSLRLSKVNKVDIKQQYMEVDTWVNQWWNNPYLVWTPKDFGGIQRLQVATADLWVPDIVLYNNVDADMPMAGGRAKFLNPITLFHNGMNIWYSSTTFKGSCEIAVDFWPFDRQTCSLLFGSMSQGKGEMNLISGDTRHRGDRFIESGEWDILTTASETNETELACCPFKFSQYNYTISLLRKSTYYIVYLMLPCTVLYLLTLMSFAIPSESGERIGFCITMLLAMAVYLLLVAGSVPETSSHIPVLGMYFILVFVAIFMALVSTIISLRLYHSSGEPGPKWQKLFGCSTCCTKQASVKPTAGTTKIVRVSESNNQLEMFPSSQGQQISQSDVKMEGKEEEEKLSWKDISVKMDRFMFCLGLVYTIAVYVHLFHRY